MAIDAHRCPSMPTLRVIDKHPRVMDKYARVIEGTTTKMTGIGNQELEANARSVKFQGLKKID
jgi:hypothetical protein